MELNVDCQDNRVRGAIHGLSPGLHTFEISYYKKDVDGNAVLVAKSRTESEIVTGGVTTITFGFFTFPDDDGDGWINLTELGSGTDPEDPASRPVLVLLSLEITPTNPSIALGTTQSFMATGTYNNGTTRDVTDEVTWSSANESLAVISNDAESKGLARGTSVGSGTIFATLDGVGGSTMLTVTPALLASIEVTPTHPSIALGTTQPFMATGTYTDVSTQDLTDQVMWSSSEELVAMISNDKDTEGFVMSLSVGDTVIGATLGSLSGSTVLTVTAARLVSIEVTPTHPSIALGTTQAFMATGTFTDGTIQDLTKQVTWNSSDNTVAMMSNAVASEGLATSLSVGNSIMTAMLGNVSGSSTLGVTAAQLVSIEVTPTNPSIALGTTQAFMATGTYTDGTTQDLSGQVMWSSSNELAGTIGNTSGSKGVVSSVSVGTTVIGATLGSMSGSTALAVTAARLVSIEVTPSNPLIPVGTTQQFNAIGTFTDGSVQNLTGQVTWSSSDTGVATIKNTIDSKGLATGVSVNAAVITATDPTTFISGSAVLTVNAAQLVSIKVTPASPSIALGIKQNFEATGTYTDSTTRDLTTQITWSSSNPDVATISNAAGTKGLATTLQLGETTIIAAHPGSGISGLTDLHVTNAELVSIEVKPTNPSISLGDKQQFTAVGTFTDDSTQDLTTQVTWSSSNPSAATISNATRTKGLATSVELGTTTITAIHPLTGITGTTRLAVVDITPPNTEITRGPPTITNSTSASFSFISSEEGSSFECQLDSKGFDACSSPILYNGLTAGIHVLEVRAVDPSGNTDPTPASYTWVIDITAPETTMTGKPANPSNLNGPSFSFTSSELGSSFECRLDGGNFSACTSPKSYTGLSDGSHAFEVRAIDSAGNTDTTSALYTWSIDTAVPETTITSKPSALSTSSSGNFGFSSSESGSTFECRLDGGAFSSCTSPKGYSGLTEGSHTFEVRATDPAGNTDSSPASYTWTVDTNAPVTTITSQPPNPSKSNSASFSFSSSQTGSTFECQLDGGGYSACTSPKSYTGLSDGSYTFEVRATDPAGNTDGTPASYTWTIDTAAPETTITSQPSNPSNSSSASFSFSSSQTGSTFECRLDGRGYTSCTSPKAYTSLGDGSHTFEVRAIDPAGNTDGSPASYTWTIDTVAPETSITSQPSNPSKSSAASFSFSSTQAGSSFECQLDGGGFGACTSPKSYTGLSDGSHTFEVKATDPAGNTDATPASYTWTIDTVAPETSITSQPSNPSKSSAASFSFSSSQTGSSLECQLDGGGYSACTSPKAYSGLGDGSHTFEVRATDPAGNTDGTPASYTWTIDTAAANTTITSQPSNPSNASSASFGFSSSETGSSFECQIDGGAFSSCTSPKSYTGLSDGSHTFEVRATDTAGNTDSSPASYTWSIDTTAPDTTITSQPSNPSNSSTASFVFGSNESGSTFECRLDGGTYSACTSPKAYTSLGDGSHTFEVRATDPLGNTDGSPASYTWTIDRVAPETAIASQPSNPSNSSSAVFSFISSQGGSSFECQLDGGSFSACTSPQSYTALTDGSHTFRVRATDPAGNTDGSPAQYTWTVDTAAPNTTIISQPSNPSNSSTASFGFSSSEPGSSFECQLNGGGFSSCTSPRSYSGLIDGSHTFEVRATDGVGNTDGTPASYTWTIDTAAPNTTITNQPSNPSGLSNPSFSFISSESGSSFECQLDGGSFSPCTSPKSYTGLTNGSHTFQVRAKDTAGNTDGSPASYTWTIDTTSPETTITSQPSNPSNSSSASFNFTSSKAGSTFECQMDAGGYSGCTSPKSYTGLTDGSHTFEVRATDTTGNTDPTPASYTWVIDTVAPNTTITSQPSNPSNSSSASFSFSSTETGGSFACQLDGGGFGACTSPKSYTGLTDGSHTFEVRATDTAGNTDATPASYTWVIDTVMPETTITSQPSNPSNSSSASFSFSSSQAGSTFECQLDGGGYSACTSPKAYTGLGDGSHTFQVRARDTAGNTDGSPASYAWTIDTAAPNTTITSQPPNPSNSNSGSFLFSSTETGSTFECRLDGGSYSACTSPKSYIGLGDGSHTFEVRAIDATGNTDATAAGYTWTIDTVAPNTTITSQPSNPSNSSSASFAFSASQTGSIFECQMDGGGYSGCTSPKAYTGLGDGSHTFEVRATDPAGNTDPTPASYTWAVDTVGPDTTITSQPLNPTSSNAASFSFTSTEVGSTFECRLDGGGYSACTSPKAYTGLGDGSHTFSVRATDPLGNIDGSPASYTWTIDTVAPETAIASQPSNPSNSSSADFSFISSELGSSFECQLDGGSFSACTSPKSYTALSDGSHTFKVRATDAAGNMDGSPAQYTWTVDTAAPNTTITSQPLNPSNSGSASFNFSSSEGGSSFACQLDAGGFSSCTSPKAYSSLTDGSHTFEVRATDTAGNTDGSPASYTWTIDTGAPQTTITSQPSNPSNSSSASFNFSSSETGSSFACQLDAGGFSPCTNPKAYSGLSDSSHTFEVRAIDTAGNTDATPASYTWAIDTVAPNTTITSQPSNPSSSSSASFTFSSSEVGSTFTCQIDGGGFSSCTSPKSYTGLADGSHTFEVRATDTAGNTDATPASYTWTIDTGAPQTTITSQPSNPSNSSSASFNFSSSETGSSFACQLDAGGFSPCTNPKAYSGLSDSSHTFEVRAIDTAGNTDATPASYTWAIDTVAPNTTITSQPSNPSNASSASFSFSSSQTGSNFECQIDAGGFSSCASPKSYSGLTDGSHTFEVRAIDSAGNVDGSPASYTWVIDTAAPNTTITSQPFNPSSSSSASFGFNSSETGSSFECQLDGGGYSGCTSPKSYTTLADGSHTFEVRAKDGSGNTDASPASYTWTIDSVAPNTTITSQPSNPSNSSSASFSFSSSETGSSFTCQLDGGGYSACTSPKAYTSLTDGSHTFEVRATDPAGNTDATPASYTWVIDTAAPETSITSQPSNPSNSSSASFSFSSSQTGSSFACQLDAGGVSPCTSPKAYSSLSDGTHTFQVRATDTAGNTDGTPASYTWVIDTTAPNTTITSQPSNPSNSSSASFSFSSSETGSNFACQLDGGGYSACTSPKSYTGLSDGSHTFEVRATDTAGNTDATPASYTWAIDTVAPNTTITSQPSNPSNSSSASFSFNSSETGSSFTCQLDGGGYSGCTSPKAYSSLSDGTHTFQVRATDTAGNTDGTPASYTWVIDTTAPNTTITSQPSNPSSSSSASFGFSSSETGSNFACQLDGGSYSACTSPKSYTGLSDGSHTFEVRATDTAGNTDANPASYTWAIDTAAPNTTITSQPSNPSNSSSASFSFNSSETGSSFTCQLDGGGYSGCTSPKSYSSLTDGSHTFEVRATDGPGNTDGTPASYTWGIDTTAPNTTITSQPSNPSNSSSASFSFSSSETGSSFACQLDGGGFSNCSSPKSYSGLSDGSHTFDVRATDPAGNTDGSPASYTWVIDTAFPNTTITSQPSNPSNSSSASFSFNSSETGSSFTCQLDGGGYSGCTSPKSYSSLTDGSHTFEVRATDGAGNTDATPASYTWVIDTVAPSTTITSQPPNPSSSDSASFNFSSSETGITFECQLDGGGYSTCSSPKSYAGLGDGSHTFEVKATDGAGNTDASPASYIWTVDTLAPETTITSQPSDPSNSSSASFSFDSNETGSTFECQLDGGGFSACTSPTSYTSLSDGSHTFEVRATDPASNTDTTPASYTWTINTI